MTLAAATMPKTKTRRKRFVPPSIIVSSVFLLVIFVLCFGVPLLPTYDPYGQNLFAAMVGPLETVDGQLYLMGTDAIGRDMLSRVALAGQVSMSIAGVAVALSLVIGIFLGLLGGFFGGLADSLIMGMADLQLAVPRIILLIAVAALVGTSVPSLTILLGVTSWVSYGRVARAMAMSLRDREFVLSATTQGASPLWNLRKHLLPNILGQMVIVGSFEFGQIITLEASLSYLGLGVQPPLPSWGMMISDGQGYLDISPWMALFPGLAVFLLIAGVQFTSQLFTAENEGELDMVDGRP